MRRLSLRRPVRRVRVFRTEDAAGTYLAAAVAAGQRAGDVKPLAKRVSLLDVGTCQSWSSLNSLEQ